MSITQDIQMPPQSDAVAIVVVAVAVAIGACALDHSSLSQVNRVTGHACFFYHLIRAHRQLVRI